MVTATTGQATFMGQSGTKYTVSIYISDVVAANVTFNPNGIAASGSQAYWQAPEPVVLADVAILTGPTVATGFSWTSGGSIIQASQTMISPNLTTNPQRVAPSVHFAKGSLIGAVQF